MKRKIGKKTGRTRMAALFLCTFLSACGTGKEAEAEFGTAEFKIGADAENDDFGTLWGRTSAEETVQGEAEERLIYVHVCGAVNNPGVVMLPEGSRAEAALNLAGGFTFEACVDSVNLAQILVDGQQLFFPSMEEALLEKKAEEAMKAGIVNLNTADEAKLCTLPGVGASRAGDIIAYRERNGVFSKIEDIMKVPGIKESLFQKIQDKITVD